MDRRNNITGSASLPRGQSNWDGDKRKASSSTTLPLDFDYRKLQNLLILADSKVLFPTAIFLFSKKPRHNLLATSYFP